MMNCSYFDWIEFPEPSKYSDGLGIRNWIFGGTYLEWVGFLTRIFSIMFYIDMFRFDEFKMAEISQSFFYENFIALLKTQNPGFKYRRSVTTSGDQSINLRAKKVRLLKMRWEMSAEWNIWDKYILNIFRDGGHINGFWAKIICWP